MPSGKLQTPLRQTLYKPKKSKVLLFKDCPCCFRVLLLLVLFLSGLCGFHLCFCCGSSLLVAEKGKGVSEVGHAMPSLLPCLCFCLDCKQLSCQEIDIQGAAKGGLAKGVRSLFSFSGHFRSLFGHLFRHFCHFFRYFFAKLLLPDSFCGRVRYLGFLSH